jgi:hypothetical protein
MTEVRQREPRIEIPELLKLARDKPCMFRVPGVCCNDTATTVWCHSNRQAHGHGLGLKSHDIHGAFGCYRCHDWYDARSHPWVRREERQRVFNEARDKTWEYLARYGHLKIAP